jgi:hypothetical protein
VTRGDSGASSVITLGPITESPLDGHWEGTLLQDQQGTTSTLILELSGGLGSPGVATITVRDEMAAWWDKLPLVLEVTETGGQTALSITNDAETTVITGTATDQNTLKGTMTTVDGLDGSTWTFTWSATRAPQ